MKEVSKDVERALAGSRGILCSFKRQKGSESLAFHGAQQTQKRSLSALLGNWLFYCTYIQKEEPQIGKLAGVYVKQQLKMSTKVPKWRSVSHEILPHLLNFKEKALPKKAKLNIVLKNFF